MIKKYIGDGVYAEFDGYHIWLTTLEGMRIALESEVLTALIAYAAPYFVTPEFLQNKLK